MISAWGRPRRRASRTPPSRQLRLQGVSFPPRRRDPFGGDFDAHTCEDDLRAAVDLVSLLGDRGDLADLGDEAAWRALQLAEVASAGETPS